MPEEKDETQSPAPGSDGAMRAKDLLESGELSSRVSERVDERAGEQLKAKDLLRAGELETEDTQSDRFGRSFMERRYRRPVGNSQRLWKKVDGDDPWDATKKKAPAKKKQRGVYAAGRFVRVDKHEAAKERAKKAGIPDWAKKTDRPAASPSTNHQAEVKATPTAEDPFKRLMQIIAQKNAEAQTKLDKASDAASRIKKKQQESAPPAPPARRTASPPPTAEAAEAAEAPSGPVPAPRPSRQPSASPKKRASSRTGRMRTSSSARSSRSRSGPPPVSQQPQKPRQFAAGRAPPKPRQAPKDLPIEMRRPPRVDPNSGAVEERDPRNRRMAAGRAPPNARKKPKDLPIEMRRPPRIGPGGAAQSGPATEIRKDSPAFHRPGKKTVSSKAAAKSAKPATTEKTAAATPVAARPVPPPAPAIDRTPPMPKKTPKPKPPGGMPSAKGGGGMDDLFGMASQEGPMRIGRRKKKKATAQPEKKAAPAPKDAQPKPPFPIPKVDYTPPVKGKKDD